ncbi:SRPBCC domain-containing protein [Arthrobacter dokdonensis]|uniref:SRPBCC domain-containing protein n=1 Tax=Arthrobacter dokdonellae TaxID=2211210 RepID=UPI000DE5B7A9|nr:SRPBCC domain-containing protein [Arthrobacter dokdonellae]
MTIEQSVFIPVDPDTAFALITEPERLRRWQTVAARVDLRVGGDYRWTITPGHSSAQGVFVPAIWATRMLVPPSMAAIPTGTTTTSAPSTRWISRAFAMVARTAAGISRRFCWQRCKNRPVRNDFVEPWRLVGS